MKKVVGIFIVCLLFACSKTEESKIIKTEEIKGYYALVEDNWSGEIIDMSENPYSYLEITDDTMYFYTESYSNKGYYDSVVEKYYVLEENKIYFDTQELTGNNWKENISEMFGGVFLPEVEEGKLILTQNHEEEDGYKISTYLKLNEEDRLLKK